MIFSGGRLVCFRAIYVCVWSLGISRMNEVRRMELPHKYQLMSDYPRFCSSGGNSSNLHQLILNPDAEKRRKRCRVCWSIGKRKDVLLVCSGCFGLPGLCSTEHFKWYHVHL
ncbi:hypothetical protein NPIL_568671 [Nephila pilipes]|uniref:PiggyBac transposable element-derived protein 4 C-terminal zinc-finger domain-containing protein n=1 Tax=Nephila pilipes TaxID=299642 RepID=A0A8X6MQN6_NEPPI|nr:hypothetical protein NPIL_568671 [Nephila pilipes]